MNYTILFDELRANVFGGKLKQSQVDGLIDLLKVWEQIAAKRGYASAVHDAWLAYILATVFHETARLMQPIKELGGERYFTEMYDISGKRPRVAKRLGNTFIGDGAKFAGRGYVQLTGRSNYAFQSKKHKVDLISQPDLLMTDKALSATILMVGMIDGDFTGKKLAHYLHAAKTDFTNARRIINGKDKARLIAGYAEKILVAIQLAIAVDRLSAIESFNYQGD